VAEPEHFEDPVFAYDRLAHSYAKLAQRRWPYLAGVEREIMARIPSRSASMLDVGAGDGCRAVRIASHARISRLVLLEPNDKMMSARPDGVEIWRCRAEELKCRHTEEQFDVVTCLWNVLGHIRGTTQRIEALAAVARLLSENGRFFMDVNHRYNVRSYGLLPTAARFAYDFFVSRDKNGDVIASWDLRENRISTYGHVFTNAEVIQLAANAGLKLEERVAIDYKDGEVRRNAFQGNLLYVFRRRA